MNRRQFLLLRTESRRRIAELSCERLYMRLLDAQLGAPGAAGLEDHASESPPRFAPVRILEVLDGLQRDLQGADTLRLVDVTWLAQPDFRARIEPVLAAFRARGGVVER